MSKNSTSRYHLSLWFIFMAPLFSVASASEATEMGACKPEVTVQRKIESAVNVFIASFSGMSISAEVDNEYQTIGRVREFRSSAEFLSSFPGCCSLSYRDTGYHTETEDKRRAKAGFGGYVTIEADLAVAGNVMSRQLGAVRAVYLMDTCGNTIAKVSR